MNPYRMVIDELERERVPLAKLANSGDQAAIDEIARLDRKQAEFVQLEARWVAGQLDQAIEQLERAIRDERRRIGGVGGSVLDPLERALEAMAPGRVAALSHTDQAPASTASTTDVPASGQAAPAGFEAQSSAGGSASMGTTSVGTGSATAVAPGAQTEAMPVAAAAGARGSERTVDQMIVDILEKEGGFVNHAADRGGPTNFGITQGTLGAWLGRAATIEDVRNLEVAVARQIFRRNYFESPGIDRLPAGLLPIVFDMAVLHGPSRAVKLLQEMLTKAGFTCDIDGGIGRETIGQAEAAWGRFGSQMVNTLVDARIAFCEAICRGDPSQRVFLRGWTNRANTFRV